MDSPFDVLRVDSDADADEIRRAYRERALETHPDQGGSAREFQLVKAAYEEIESGHWGSVRNGATGNGDGDSDSEKGAEDDTDDDDDDPDEAVSRVEYLDYEVIDDQGWDLGDEDLFEKASGADLSSEDYGQLLVRPNESLLEAAESRGLAWPYACRGGACANCAILVTEGELRMPHDTVLPPEMIDSGIRLSCNGMPITDEMRVVYNVKHLPGLDELRLPPRPFEQAYAGD